jgi:hypothetical protein
MKATAILAAGIALLSMWLCQPAEAKVEDFNAGKLKAASIKSGSKIKPKKYVTRLKLQRKKLVLGGEPVSSKTIKTVTERRSPISPPNAKSSVAKPPKPVVAKLTHKPDAKAPKPANGNKIALSEPRFAPRLTDIVKLEPVDDGLPPFVRANRRKLELDKRAETAAIIAAMAPCQKVPVWFALRVAMTESSLNPKARGSAGEIGLFQMKCATARYLGFTGECEGLYDTRTNIYWGLKHLSRALQFSDGDPRHAASKHNGGLGTKGLRADYVRQVMCSSARSGFPSAYQLGASTDILRMCARTNNQPKAMRGHYDKKDLLTSSIAEIGLRTASTARIGPAARTATGCGDLDFKRVPVLASQTDAKRQHKPAKKPVVPPSIGIIGSLNPIYPSR